MRQAPILRTRRIAVHTILGAQTLIAILPVLLVIMNSFKDRKAIFSQPMMPPGPDSFSLIGYETVLRQGDFLNYFFNSSIVTVGSIFFILLFGAMAAFALTEYRFRGNVFLGLFLALGVMVPIRLGTVGILEIMARSGLVNTLTALILAPAEATKNITFATQVFIGQFVTNWNAVLAALTLSITPVLILYALFSRQLIRGITAGAVK